MAQRPTLITSLALNGLEVAPSQVWGSIRIVPLLRRHARGDLRLAMRRYDEPVSLVTLKREIDAPGPRYIACVPHALVLSWSAEGHPVAAYGGHLGQPSDGRRPGTSPCGVRLVHRMAKRETGNRLRFLPLHLAMEGFLSLYFSGPEIAWTEYSRRALRRGLDPRMETSRPGGAIRGLEDALRVFEIHDDQVGVLVFVAEALASAFVVPTPEDYRALHSSLLEDFYGELLYQYGLLYPTALPLEASIDAGRIGSLDALSAAAARMRAEWAEFHGFQAGDLLGREVAAKPVYVAGAFTLQRFMTGLRPDGENHLGEAIVRENGELEYLKTYRLSAAQTRRAYLLSRLAEHDWHLEATAEALNATLADLIKRFDNAGFGYLLTEEVQTRRERR